MNLLKRLLRRSSPPSTLASTTEGEDQRPDEAIDAAFVLIDWAERGEVGNVLNVLDLHMDALLEQGEDVLKWTTWVEEGFNRAVEPLSTSQLAVLGSVYQRLEGEDRVAYCHRALSYYQGAIEGYRRAESAEGIAVLLNNSGLLYAELAQTDAAQYRCAIPLFEEALGFYEDRDELYYRGAICLSLGEAYARLDEAGADHFELARDFYERAWALFERSGDLVDQAMAQGGLGDMQVELAAFYGPECLGKAVRHFRNALSVYVDLDDVAAQAMYQERLGRTYAELQEEEHLRKALRSYERALAGYLQCENDQRAARVGLQLAHVAIGVSELETAFEAASQARKLFIKLDLGEGEALSCRLLARIYLSAGDQSQRADLEQAERCLLEAQRLFLEAQMSVEYGEVIRELEQVQSLTRGAGD